MFSITSLRAAPVRFAARGVLAAAVLLLGACDRPTESRPHPVPAVTAATPTVAPQGAAFTLTVTGTGFVRESVVRWNGADRPTTYVSATQLTAQVSAADVAEPGAAEVSVFTPEPGGGASAALTLQVRPLVNPVPAVASISPAMVIARAGGAVTVRGTGFVPETRVLLVGTDPLVPTFVSSTELQFAVEPWMVPAAGELRIWLRNPTPGGGISTVPGVLPVHNPQPVVTQITPAHADAGQDSLVVRVIGTHFVQGTQVTVGGAAQPTRYVSPNEVRAALAPEALSVVGTVPLAAVNPAPGGGSSAAVLFTLAAPLPVLTMLPSEGASAGRGGFVLRVHGTAFVRSSVVRWNGADRATRYISNRRLEIDVSSADVAAAGSAAISVHTPDGGTSQAAQLVIRNVPAATRSGLRSLVMPAVDMIYDPHSARLYVSLGANASRPNRILAIDPATGTVVDSVAIPGDPATLAVSDDGSTLWVELNATHEIRRVALPSLTPGASFSTDGHFVAEMHALAGQPGTIAVALENPYTSPRYRGVAVYDNGVRRAQTAPSHLGAGTIAWGEDAGVIYGADAEVSSHPFYTLRVDGGGVTEARETGGLTAWYMRIRYANGRVYGTSGAVIDAARHERLGSFDGGGFTAGLALLPDTRLGRVFYVNDGVVTAYDMNTFKALGSFRAGDGFQEHPASARLRLVRWAPDGLAYRVDSRIIIFRTPLAAP